MTHSPDIQFPMLFARLLNPDGAVVGLREIGRMAMPPHIVVQGERAFRLQRDGLAVNLTVFTYVEETVRFVKAVEGK